MHLSSSSYSRCLALPLVALLLSAGCAVGPDYRRPALPGKLAERPTPNTTPASATDAAKPWWQRANDPALAELVERALAGNRDLRGAMARLQEARALRREARAAFLPTGSVSAGYRRQLDSTVFFPGVPRDFREQNIFDVGLDAAWELDLFGRIRRNVEAGTALAEAAEADLAQFRLVIAAEAARAYIEATAARSLRTLREQQVSAGRQSLDLVRRQVDAGKVGRERLGRAEADLAALETSLRELRLAERAARNRLAVLTGDGVAPSIRAEIVPALPVPDLNLDPLLILSRRPDVTAAERRLAASTATIGVARADYLPSLRFVGRVGAEANQVGDLDRADANLFAFGPRLSWDLLNWQRTRARVQGAEARTEQALAAWENTVLLALEEIDNTLARHEEARARRGDWQRAADAANEAQRIVGLRRTEGVADPLEALAADQAALEGRFELVRSDAELASSVILLQQCLALER